MKENERKVRRREECGTLTGEALERHLFTCSDCRGDVRLSAVWDTLRGSRSEGAPAAAGDAFVARVLHGVRRERTRERRWRLLLAAAAVLLFFFAAGANSGNRANGIAGTEEVYAGMAAPSPALEGLLLPE